MPDFVAVPTRGAGIQIHVPGCIFADVDGHGGPCHVTVLVEQKFVGPVRHWTTAEGTHYDGDGCTVGEHDFD